MDSRESDSSFWSQVLRRWSDASSSVVRLKAELDQVREERDKLKEQLNKPETRHFAMGRDYKNTENDEDNRNDEDNKIALNKLRELEAGIGKAQDRYQKLEQQLNGNAEKIRDLLTHNKQLRREREILELERDELHDTLKRTEADLIEARTQNAVLHDEIRSLSASATMKPPTPQTSEIAVRDEIRNIYQPKIATLERELEILRKSFHEIEQENHALREELGISRETFHKYKLTKKALPESVITKIRDIPRNISRSYRGSLVPSASGSRLDSNRNATSTEPVEEKTATIDMSRTEDLTIVEDYTTGTPRTVPPVLPSFRDKELSLFPGIIPTTDTRSSDNAFSREFMTNTLGGSNQPLIVRIPRQSNLSKQRGISSYLCPSLDHNPWCPSEPGSHGYIFVGLGREKDAFIQPEIHNVFVGLPKPKMEDTRRFRYLGKYSAVRVNSLSIGEWTTLSSHVKAAYAKATKAKTKDSRTVEQIVIAYDHGELYVPCVRLECIGFDEQLYTSLVAESASRPRGKSQASSRARKRALEQYDADDDCARKKRTVGRAS